MKKYYIKVSSVTHAMKGREVLSSKGFKVAIRRNLRPQRNDEGCGYSLYIDSRVEEAVEILKRRNVNVLGYGDVSDFR
ncbi:MAG: DUF3343 domain-containing protein [Clostridia bacterium]|nr:DUF3343 domain-containing protein [Clostridia bacterium]